MSFMNSCLEILFPEKQLAEILGMNSAEFHRLVQKFFLNFAKIFHFNIEIFLEKFCPH